MSRTQPDISLPVDKDSKGDKPSKTFIIAVIGAVVIAIGAVAYYQGLLG